MRVLSVATLALCLLAGVVMAADEASSPALRNGNVSRKMYEMPMINAEVGPLSAFIGIILGIIDVIRTIIGGVPEINDCDLSCNQGRLVFVADGETVVALFNQCASILFCETVGGPAIAKIDCGEGFLATPLGCQPVDLLTNIEDSTDLVPTCPAPACDIEGATDSIPEVAGFDFFKPPN